MVLNFMDTPLGRAAHTHYQELFAEKLRLTREEFAEFEPRHCDAFASPEAHFRMRAEFKIWHNDSGAHYAMHQPGEYKQVVIIDQFDIGSASICRLMPLLLTAINASALLKAKLFQIEFLTNSAGDALVTLIYHKKLNDAWLEQARQLQDSLKIHIIGRSRGQKVVLEKDFITERFTVGDSVYSYHQVETGFTQPNAAVCEHMLNWAQSKSQNFGGDLLELYCGNGNFTLPLAKNFRRVLATEVSKNSVKSALINIQQNNIHNIDIVRMSSEELTSALNGEREYRRLKEIELEDFNFSTVFVDPPRSGLDEATEQMVSRFENILYISCNPETLKHNLRTLCITHYVEHLAFFDQFPYTHHRECGVVLKKR